MSQSKADAEAQEEDAPNTLNQISQLKTFTQQMDQNDPSASEIFGIIDSFQEETNKMRLQIDFYKQEISNIK